MQADIEKFLITKEGKDAYKKYHKLCQINPQNLYVDETDFEVRYREEHLLLEKCLCYFTAKGYELEKIIADIPEILEYYPYFKTEMEFPSEDMQKEPFYILLREWNIDFYGKVNPRKYGEYYTSLEMIRVALPELERRLEHTVIDPSCGSGFILYAYVAELLKEAAKQYDREILIRSIQKNIYGFDVFPVAVITTKLLLGYCLYENFGFFDGIFQFCNVRVLNTLSTLKCLSKDNKGVPQFDLIIGNPPFFRVNPNSSRNVCKCTQYGHQYSHSLFLHWSLQYLKDKGDFCLILPESMLTGYYYQKVRKELLEKASIRNIIINKEHEKLFDVQQDVMILIGRKGKREDFYYTSSSDISDRVIKRYKLPIALCDNRCFVIPAIKGDESLEILREISKDEMIPELEKFQVSTGNYVWNQNKDRCFREKGEGRLPLISGPSIVDGEIVVEHNRKNTYMYCEPDKPHYILNKKAILFRRMSPMENPRRFVGAIIEPEETGEYVVENHVNIVSGNEEHLERMYRFLDSEKFNEALKMFCRTNQVSVSDIHIVFEILTKLRKVESGE